MKDVGDWKKTAVWPESICTGYAFCYLGRSQGAAIMVSMQILRGQSKSEHLGQSAKISVV